MYKSKIVGSKSKKVKYFLHLLFKICTYFFIYIRIKQSDNIKKFIGITLVKIKIINSVLKIHIARLAASLDSVCAFLRFIFDLGIKTLWEAFN